MLSSLYNSYTVLLRPLDLDSVKKNGLAAFIIAKIALEVTEQDFCSQTVWNADVNLPILEKTKILVFG